MSQQLPKRDASNKAAHTYYQISRALQSVFEQQFQCSFVKPFLGRDMYVKPENKRFEYHGNTLRWCKALEQFSLPLGDREIMAVNDIHCTTWASFSNPSSSSTLQITLGLIAGSGGIHGGKGHQPYRLIDYMQPDEYLQSSHLTEQDICLILTYCDTEHNPDKEKVTLEDIPRLREEHKPQRLEEYAYLILHQYCATHHTYDLRIQETYEVTQLVKEGVMDQLDEDIVVKKKQ